MCCGKKVGGKWFISLPMMVSVISSNISLSGRNNDASLENIERKKQQWSGQLNNFTIIKRKKKKKSLEISCQTKTVSIHDRCKNMIQCLQSRLKVIYSTKPAVYSHRGEILWMLQQRNNPCRCKESSPNVAPIRAIEGKAEPVRNKKKKWQRQISNQSCGSYGHCR